MNPLARFSFIDLNPARLGVAGAIVTLAFVTFAYALGTLGLFDDTYEMSVVLPETGGLRSGDTVRVAGIDVGSVKSVDADFDAGVVVATFEVESGVELGQMTTAEVSLSTLLGGRYLRLDGPVEAPYMHELPTESRRIPIQRTRIPVGVIDALGQLTNSVEQIDVDEVDALVAASAEVARDNASAAKPLINDVVTLSSALNARATEIDELLTATSQTTSALASKEAAIDQLIIAAEDLLSEVAARKEQVRTVLGSGSSAVARLDELLAENESSLQQILDNADATTDVLRERLPELNQTLAIMGPTLLEGSTWGASGTWIDAAIEGLGPVQIGGILGSLLP